MTAAPPDLDALVSCAIRLATAMGQGVPPPSALRVFLEELLFKPQSAGGKELWGCYADRIITHTELRNVVMAHLATWLSASNGVIEPSCDTYTGGELELRFDRALAPEVP